jgi:hypothetical protein
MTCRAAGGIVLSARVLVDSSFAEVAGDAMRVTAARDEPWRHLAHGGRQAVEVSVTCSAPPGHRPSRPSRWCPGSTGKCNRATHLSAYPASPSARLMTTRRGCSRAGAGGELGLGGSWGLESKRFSTCDCMCVRLMCRDLAAGSSLHHITTQHRNIVSVTSISSVLTVYSR